MFKKLLIANRGEIACRVIKTARAMGIQTVAVYSDADRDALHVKLADEAIHIGPPPSQESYLVIDKILDAAVATSAQAIHPGYGFLSENAEFAHACSKRKITFVGPPVGAIESMGSKSAAKSIMENAGVPLLPGYHGDDQSDKVLRKAAKDIGYPVLLKAVAGGGGKGMRQVWSEKEFDEALQTARGEARSSFGNDDMLVEKFLTQPRHVEVQVFRDQHGNAVYLFERDCSIQRRHQKVIEEAPAPGLSETLRERFGTAAVRAAEAIDYQGAGTVEFLLDGDDFYFMEMNTRLQVEHPVTEMITGQDLVEWQLRVANGEPLPSKQNELQINGHAFEARIYAENPDNEFLPDTGTLTHVQLPPTGDHVRIDTGVLEGDVISPYYDPMIAKLIVWDESRTRALTRLEQALTHYQISGVITNIPFLYNIAATPAFGAAELSTGFIDEHRDELFKASPISNDEALPMIGLYLWLRQAADNRAGAADRDTNSPWYRLGGWRLNQPQQLHYPVMMDDESFMISITDGNHDQVITAGDQQWNAHGELTGDDLEVEINGHRQQVVIAEQEESFVLYTKKGARSFTLIKPDLGDHSEDGAESDCRAPMNGTVVEVSVKAGDQVKEGQTLLILEAMKMQHTVRAPADGTVSQVFYAAGDLVEGGAELIEFEST